MFFKKAKQICFHDWKVIDFHSIVDISLGIDEFYELGCINCGTKKSVDEVEFDLMKMKGLVVSR